MLVSLGCGSSISLHCRLDHSTTTFFKQHRSRRIRHNNSFTETVDFTTKALSLSFYVLSSDLGSYRPPLRCVPSEHDYDEKRPTIFLPSRIPLTKKGTIYGAIQVVRSELREATYRTLDRSMSDLRGNLYVYFTQIIAPPRKQRSWQSSLLVLK